MAKRGNRRGRRVLQPPSQQYPSQQHPIQTQRVGSYPVSGTSTQVYPVNGSPHASYIRQPPHLDTAVVQQPRQRRRSLSTDIAECGLLTEKIILVPPHIAATIGTKCSYCEVSGRSAYLAKCYHCGKTFCAYCSRLCDVCWEDVCYDCMTPHQGFCRGYPEKEHQQRDTIDDAPVKESDVDWHGCVI